jgi:hypothetical protein
VARAFSVQRGDGSVPHPHVKISRWALALQGVAQQVQQIMPVDGDQRFTGPGADHVSLQIQVMFSAYTGNAHMDMSSARRFVHGLVLCGYGRL